MLLDPLGVYLYINPPQPAAPTPVSSRKGSGRGTPVKRNDEPIGRTKVDEEEEKEQDRKARLRVGAFGATDWVLSGYPSFLYSTCTRIQFITVCSFFMRVAR